MRRILAVCLLCAIWSPAVPCAAEPAGPLSLPEYIQALDDLLVRARQLQQSPENTSGLSDALPDAWHVRVEDKYFEIPTDSLRRDLRTWQDKGNEGGLQRVIQHLETLRSEAAGYGEVKPDSSSRRAQLDKILARSEFNSVHAPTWMDRLKQRAIQWLIRLVGRAAASSVIPNLGNYFVYGLILIAVLVSAYWMYRSIQESARLESIMPSVLPVSAKEWPVWLSEARAAAARGEWREAVHLAYWSGISYLEAQGAWRPDAARTPREYLRLLPPSSEQWPALRSLTGELELVWYGMHSADEESFQQALAKLEKLGCPCN
jgi:Domain of unknown function (DUF4129)